jgi:hypothetical protein
MQKEYFKKEAMLLSEYTAILEWIRDTVKVDAGGQIPLGVCYVDTANIAANFSDGDRVGVALSIPIVRKESLAAGAREFVNQAGTTVSTYP